MGSAEQQPRVAMVTGASRGIGKAIAIELAAAGFAVAITARTVREGEQREHSSTLRKTDTTPLPGSLDSTLEEIGKLGGKALALAADLMEHDTLGAATAEVIEHYGRLDVLVHCGRYVGPGHMDLFLDTPIDILRKHLEANCLGPMVMNQIAIPQMLRQGSGTIVHITSSAGFDTPAKPAGQGGWGMGYGISKAAFHRTAGILNTELAGSGLNFFNVQPGFVVTERMKQDMGEFGFGTSGAAPIVPAKVVRWLCTDPEARQYSGKTIAAQPFCLERGLLPGWSGPAASGPGILDV
jgi:NAD(P)-dependent dehydrogenase (short-subunit alcohol dehydrogenase family)